MDELPATMFCGIIIDEREECGIDFAIMVAQLPFEARFRRLNITFARTVAEAYAAFKASPDFEALACVPVTMSNMAFFKRALADPTRKRCVVGRWPVPRIDWDAVAAGQAPTRFNIPDASLSAPDTSGYRKLADSKLYDFDAGRLPECFVLHRGGEANMWVDDVERFDSMAKVEFAGCAKLRLSEPMQAS